MAKRRDQAITVRKSIANIQTSLIDKSATQIFARVKDLGSGSFELIDNLDALGLTVDSSGTIVAKNDNVGARKTAKLGTLEWSDYPAVATNAQIDVPIAPEGAIYKVVEINGHMVCDANAANRSIQVIVVQTMDGAPRQVSKTTAFNLTAGQLGGILMTDGLAPNWFKNVANTLTVVTNENALPHRMTSTLEYIQFTATNKQVGDVLKLRAFYERVA